MRTIIVIAAAALALAGCKQAGTSTSPVTEAEATRIAETAEASFTTRDVKAIMNQYADSATMIDAANPTPSADRKVQSGWTQNFASMKPADYQVSDRKIQIVGPDAFVSSGVESFTVAAGQARPRVSARFTDVFQRQKNGSWKIVHEHVSMPPTPTGALK